MKKGFILGLLVLFLASFSGCGGDQAPAGEGKAKKAKKGGRKGKRGKKKAAAAEEQERLALDFEARPWEYNASDKWDPFKVPPPPIRGESSAERFALEEMNLLGVVRGSGMDAAYIRLPDGTDRIVRVGDILGKHGGEVKEIGKDFLIVEEKYMDPKRPTDTFIIEKELRIVETLR